MPSGVEYGPPGSESGTNAWSATRRFGNGPMLPVSPNCWAVPVATSRARTCSGVQLSPCCCETLDRMPAAPATIGDALDVPPNELAYASLPIEAPCRVPYPVVTTHWP